MCPTEIDMSTFSVDKSQRFSGCEINRCEETAKNIERSTTEARSTASQSMLADLDSDDLTCLFKLAVIFTRGNPFNSRKHWRMKTQFIEAKFKIECFKKPREADEEDIDFVDVVAETLVSYSEPKVRYIHVAPCQPDEDTKVDNVSAPCNLDCDVMISIERRKGDFSCNTDSNEYTVDYPSLPVNTISQELNRPSSDGVSQFIPNEIVYLDTQANNERPGYFMKAIRRFLKFFRKHRVAVAPSEQ